MTEIYMRLFQAVTDVVKENREDLTDSDRAEIVSRPGVSFIHYAKRFGTTLIFLPLWSDATNWPAKGMARQMTYGLANREEILAFNLEWTRKLAAGMGRDVRLVHYFDGHLLNAITTGKAKHLAEEHSEFTLREWRNGQGSIV